MVDLYIADLYIVDLYIVDRVNPHLFSSARAIQHSWRCPADKLEPPSSKGQSRPRGWLRTWTGVNTGAFKLEMRVVLWLNMYRCICVYVYVYICMYV